VLPDALWSCPDFLIFMSEAVGNSGLDHHFSPLLSAHSQLCPKHQGLSLTGLQEVHLRHLHVFKLPGRSSVYFYHPRD
jgi:hypothetical protein